MQIEFMHQPGNTAARVRLGPGETLTTEGGAMIAMSAHLAVETTSHQKGTGGLLKAVKRVFAGESFFLNHFSTTDRPGEIWLGSSLAGDMMRYALDNEALIVRA
ncbi:MAG TPA: AIM24 family protein, partial [Moraxellaceae bacterium]|nr:AIM24 family protein [Moraxellaceae bacterium]